MHLDFLDQILDHNHLHEALWLMHKTGMENRSDQNLNHVWLLGEGKVNKYDISVFTSFKTIFLFQFISTLNLKLRGYNGRGPSQCNPESIEV